MSITIYSPLQALTIAYQILARMALHAKTWSMVTRVNAAKAILDRTAQLVRFIKQLMDTIYYQLVDFHFYYILLLPTILLVLILYLFQYIYTG